VIIILCTLLSIYVCLHHETWSDEVNLWLIARDSSVLDIFKIYMYQEGHPALWYLVIKFFQCLNLKYQYFFIIPLIFSNLGLAIFMFKSDYKLYIKVLLPFTYFIFYQYTVMARGYSFILPLLSIIACIYPKRHEKIYTYTIALILLLSLEAYTYLISGAFSLFYIAYKTLFIII